MSGFYCRRCEAPKEPLFRPVRLSEAPRGTSSTRYGPGRVNRAKCPDCHMCLTRHIPQKKHRFEMGMRMTLKGDGDSYVCSAGHHRYCKGTGKVKKTGKPCTCWCHKKGT